MSNDPKLNEYGIILEDPGYDPFADMMALGDGYMMGKWWSRDLELTLTQLMRSRDIVRLVKNKHWDHDEEVINLQQAFPRELVDGHYNPQNEVILNMMGGFHLYTCADWRQGAHTLEMAQSHKVERINQKLELEDDMTVLDLGCGWGGYAQLTKLNYDVKIVGVTLAEQSASMAREFCDKVIVGDYSEAKGRYDRVISLGLLEHVGADNYKRYMRTVNRCLKPGGISLFQTIGYNTSAGSINPWINERIFPNSQLPAFSQLSEAMEGLFVLEDAENMGYQYALTAQAWYDNFASAVRTGALTVSAEFARMWEFYIMFFKAAFVTRHFQLWQVVMSKQRYLQAVRV